MFCLFDSLFFFFFKKFDTPKNKMEANKGMTFERDDML